MEDTDYVTFVLFPHHFTNPATISHVQLFRDYLHYHIKCSKVYMHSRMRHRVAEFQKVLNRAKTEVATTERKTVRFVDSFLLWFNGPFSATVGLWYPDVTSPVPAHLRTTNIYYLNETLHHSLFTLS